jgi:hypothetical protein
MLRASTAWTLLLATVLVSRASAQSAADLADTLRHQASTRGALAWSASHPIVWADFRGKPRLGTPTAAQTSSGVSYVIQCRDAHLAFAVLAAFVPTESWVRPDVPLSPTANAPTLRHERTHFAITELFARRLRAALATSQGICPHHTKDARRIFDQLKSAADDLQTRYDRETAHGTNPGNQAQWDRKIGADLDSLNSYALEAGKDQ